MSYVFRGTERVPVVVHPFLERGQSEFLNGTLFIGKGTDIHDALWAVNVTKADIRFLKSINIEAP
ncbi:MAG TPA: hypothetical protein VGR34_06405 [Candidatus Dormibacteraeota bacterium]|nr:hypothetical protein [Candidatus Dormibacteraeota bacterium]